MFSLSQMSREGKLVFILCHGEKTSDVNRMLLLLFYKDPPPTLFHIDSLSTDSKCVKDIDKIFVVIFAQKNIKPDC